MSEQNVMSLICLSFQWCILKFCLHHDLTCRILFSRKDETQFAHCLVENPKLIKSVYIGFGKFLAEFRQTGQSGHSKRGCLSRVCLLSTRNPFQKPDPVRELWDVNNVFKFIPSEGSGSGLSLSVPVSHWLRIAQGHVNPQVLLPLYVMEILASCTFLNQSLTR